jgi:uncharacterized SAM-dependent methyltransferase
MKKTNTTNKIDETTVLINQLKKEVDEGLSNVEKSLPSKYFYETGDFYKKSCIYQSIM